MFCRLCFRETGCSGEDCGTNSSLIRDKVRSVFPGMNLFLTEVVQLCPDCTSALNLAINLRTRFSMSNLEIIQQNSRTSTANVQTCKLCYQNDRFASPKPPPVFLTDAFEFRRKVIEIALSTSKLRGSDTIESNICSPCWSCVTRVYDFKMKCLVHERNLNLYCQKMRIKVLTPEYIRQFLTSNVATPEYLETAVQNDACMDTDDEFNEELEIANLRNETIVISSDEEDENDNDSRRESVDDCLRCVNADDQRINEEIKIDIEECVLSYKDSEVKTLFEVDKLSLNETSDIPATCAEDKAFTNINNNICCQTKKIDLTLITSDEAKELRIRWRSNRYLWGCYLCPQVFAEKKSAGTHFLKHAEYLGRKNFAYSCKFCPFGSNWKGAITRHKPAHRRQVPDNTLKELIYMCAFCSSSYKRKGELIMHMEEHVKSWVDFQCNACIFSCKRSEGLRKHYRAKHTISKDPLFLPKAKLK